MRYFENCFCCCFQLFLSVVASNFSVSVVVWESLTFLGVGALGWDWTQSPTANGSAREHWCIRPLGQLVVMLFWDHLYLKIGGGPTVALQAAKIRSLCIKTGWRVAGRYGRPIQVKWRNKMTGQHLGLKYWIMWLDCLSFLVKLSIKLIHNDWFSVQIILT